MSSSSKATGALRIAPLAACIGVLALFACGGRNDYSGGAVTAGLGVAAAGVNRAVTKDCWGQCLNGLVCDHVSGMCVKRAPCGGRCAPDERCAEEGVTSRCTRSPEPLAPPGLAWRDAGIADASPDGG